MSTPKDTLSRLLALVQLIPLFPRYINTTTLHEKLTARGYRVDVRTVQRDLERLAQAFPVICDENTKPFQWSLNSDLNLQLLDTPSALALHLAETQVCNILPQSVADQVKPLPDSDWYRLQTTVLLDQEALWWIFDLNERICVHALQIWVDKISEAISNIQMFYQQHNDASYR